jgi:hypothetical protein
MKFRRMSQVFLKISGKFKIPAKRKLNCHQDYIARGRL